MTWWAQSQLVLKFILVATILLCRFYRPPRAPTPFDNCTHAAIFLSTTWSALGGIADFVQHHVSLKRLSAASTCLDFADICNVKMVFIIGACLWLAARSIQTLHKPIDELLKILNFEAPETPDTSLSAITSYSATIQWSSPQFPKNVSRFLIQVNGVMVGESANHETAITVTGLKPNHYYNVCVIAVGTNNYQVPSRVVRLQTYDVDGRPGGAETVIRTPQSEAEQKPRPVSGIVSVKPSVTSVESISDHSANTPRDNHVHGQRRNTINRKPPPTMYTETSAPPEPDNTAVLGSLNADFERLNNEIEEVLAMQASEEADFLKQEQELKDKIAEKRQQQREKESRSEALRRSLRAATDSHSSVKKEKARKEQAINEKKQAIERSLASIQIFKNKRAELKAEREGFESEKQKITDGYKKESTKLDDEIAKLNSANKDLETELGELGQAVRELKATQQNKAAKEVLDRIEDENKDERDRILKDIDSCQEQVHATSAQRHKLEGQLNIVNQAREQFVQSQSRNGAIGPMTGPYYGNGNMNVQSVADIEGSMMNGGQHMARVTSNNSPQVQYHGIDTYNGQQFSAGNNYTEYMDSMEPYHEIPTGLHSQEASSEYSEPPLSPNAHNYIPSGILGDSADVSDTEGAILSHTEDGTVTPPPANTSPAMLNLSPNAVSSPHDSSTTLSFPPIGSETPNRLSLTASCDSTGARGNSSSNEVTPTRATSNWLGWGRSKNSLGPELGPSLGSLKASQTRSLPRFGDSLFHENPTPRNGFSFFRRTNPTTITSNSFTPSVPARSNTFTVVGSSALGGVPDRDLSSPRPMSIASPEIPRPSTESGPWANSNSLNGINGGPGWPSDPWGSRIPSRRTSIHGINGQQGFTTAERVFESEGDYVARTVGVIGSRPPNLQNAQSMSPNSAARLNPKAPTFMAGLFRKDEYRRHHDRNHNGSDDEDYDCEYISEGSPSDHRKAAKNGGYDSYDAALMELPFEWHQDNSLRKLFRKGNARRFSFSSRLGKKGSGSISTTSDRNLNGRSSMGSADDLYDEAHIHSLLDLGYSAESLVSTSSNQAEPLPVVVKDKEKDKSMKGWRFSMGNKKKEKVRDGDEEDGEGR